VWSPTIRAALLAEAPWLDVFCPGCGTSRAIDLRTLDRHPLALVGTLVLGLRCSWCPGTAPMPKLLGLYALPPANRLGASGIQGQCPGDRSEAWQALKPAEQKAQVKSRLIRIEPQCGRASDGRVTVKVF
jgi:hypothetical protein